MLQQFSLEKQSKMSDFSEIAMSFWRIPTGTLNQRSVESQIELQLVYLMFTWKRPLKHWVCMM